MSSNFLKLYALCIVHCALMTGCSTETGSEGPAHSVVVTSPEPAYSTVQGGVALPGTVREVNTVKASFKAAGQLLRVSVKEGDYVQRGQVVAQLDAEDYQIGLDAALSQYNQLKSEVERLRTLKERNSVSANEFEKAEAGLEQALSNVQNRRNQVAYCTLHSPASGYVQDVYAHSGEMVDAGTTVFTIIDVSQMQVEVQLPADLYRRRDDMRAYTAKVGDKEYQLSLVSIAPKADGTQMYKMLLALPADRALTVASGTNVEVTIALDSPQSHAVSGVTPEVVYTLPISAIGHDEAQPFVWIVAADSTLQRRNVTLGTVGTEGTAQIVAGLQPADRVVRAGVAHLSEGEKVTVIAPPANPGNLQ